MELVEDSIDGRGLLKWADNNSETDKRLLVR